MLKIKRSFKFVANPKEIKSKAGDNNVVGNNMVGNNEATNQTNPTKRKKLAKITKSKNHDFLLNSRNREAKTSFFIPETRLAFIQLRQAFVKASILHYFNLECHIQIETDTLGYAIANVLSQLLFGTRPDGVVTKTDLGQWHLIGLLF